MSYFDTKSYIILFSLTVLAFIYIRKKKVEKELLIAFLFALFIASYSGYVHGGHIYEGFNLLIGKVNLFPLISWTTGLVVLREIYNKLEGKYRFILVSLIYVTLLFIFEYIGYYKLGIRVISSYDYESIFGLGIIHGPFLKHIFYVTAGPVYILVTGYLNIILATLKPISKKIQNC